MTDRPSVPRPPLHLRAGERIWRLFTSVDFAVAQLILLALLGAVGMTLQQLPDWAYRSAGDYATALAGIHARYDATLGPGLVDLLDRLGAFGVFRAWWFSLALVVLLLSIVICTIDRTPRLWRGVSEVRVAQPDPYFDPRLPDRAALDGVAAYDVERVLRRHRFHVRRSAAADGTTYLYGDRNQYTKMATLLTHLGLILFLVAAAVTGRFGYEAPMVVADGEVLTVQAIGTPGLLVARNNGFSAPRLPDGGFADFTTDLSIFRDGEELARKTIRVNDPLVVAGFTFHQNGFGPAPVIRIRGTDGALLWSGPVSLTDAVEGRPYGTMTVPGRDFGIQLLLDRAQAGSGATGSGASGSAGSGAAELLVIPYRVVGRNEDGTDRVQGSIPFVVPVGASRPAPTLDIVVEFERVAAYTLLIAKQDPGQGLVWGAFGTLIAGLAITFYLPRRRVWTRLSPTGELALVGRSDRYVDFEREFGRLLDDLVRARRGSDAPDPTAALAATSDPTAPPDASSPPGTSTSPSPG